MKNQQIAKLTNELNKLKQNEFVTKMKIKKEQDDAIKNFHDRLKPFTMVTRSFIVEFKVK